MPSKQVENPRKQSPTPPRPPLLPYQLMSEYCQFNTTIPDTNYPQNPPRHHRPTTLTVTSSTSSASSMSVLGEEAPLYLLPRSHTLLKVNTRKRAA